MKKTMVFTFAVLLCFMFTAVSFVYANEERVASEVKYRTATAKGTTSSVGDLGSDPFAVDSYSVTCGKKTTICADVGDAGPFFDNTFHVTVTCINTKNARASDQELTDGGISSLACVSSCKEAIITYTCELNDACDDDYDSIISCDTKDPKVEQITDQP